MKKVFRKIFRKRIIFSVLIIVLIAMSVYYLSSSKVALKKDYDVISTNQFNDQLFFDIEKNFDGNVFEYSISENEINNYINSFFQELKDDNRINIIGSDNLEIEVFCSTINKKLQVNVKYLFINTTLFFNVSLENDNHEVQITFDDFELGSARVGIPNYLSGAIVEKIIPKVVDVPKFIDLHDIAFVEDEAKLTFSLNHEYLEDVFIEYSKQLDPEILKSEYIGDNKEAYDYIISFFSNSSLTNEKINEMTLNLLWNSDYFEVMTLIKKEGESEYNNFIEDVSLFSSTIDSDTFVSKKKSYKQRLDDMLEENILERLAPSKETLFNIVYEYIFTTESNEYTSRNSALYTFDTHEVINVNLLSRKGLLDISQFSRWDIYCKGNQVYLGYNTEIGYIIYPDMQNYKIYPTKKDALISVNYQLKSLAYPSMANKEEQVAITACINNYENINETFVRFITISDNQAYVIASPKNSQVIKQYLLLKSDSWQVLDDFKQSENLREVFNNKHVAFNEKLLPLNEISQYEIHFLTDVEIEKFEATTQVNNIIDDFTTIDQITQIDDIVYFITGDGDEFIQVSDSVDGVTNVSYLQINGLSFKDISNQVGKELPFFIRLLR